MKTLYYTSHIKADLGGYSTYLKIYAIRENTPKFLDVILVLKDQSEEEAIEGWNLDRGFKFEKL